MNGLHTKYRSGSLNEIWGNAETVRTLKGLISKPGHPRTYLFHGDRGCGKTTTARAMAKEVGGTEIFELNVADQRGIDDARGVLRELSFPPVSGKRVYILDECHQANSFWEDAMLKALEEPPGWAYFFLCTTDPGKVKKTIRSRCQEFSFSALSEREMKGHILKIIDAEGATLDPQDLLEVIKAGEGNPRETLVILDQILATPEIDRGVMIGKLSKEKKGFDNLAQALLKGDIRLIQEALAEAKKEGKSEESIRMGILGYMAAVMSNSGGDTLKRAYAVAYSFREPFYNSKWSGLVFACFDTVFGGS